MLDQKYVLDESGSKTIEQLLKEQVASLGENIKINKFARIEVGA